MNRVAEPAPQMPTLQESSSGHAPHTSLVPPMPVRNPDIPESMTPE